jgi:hypothetical protein
MSLPSQLPQFDHTTNIWWRVVKRLVETHNRYRIVQISVSFSGGIGFDARHRDWLRWLTPSDGFFWRSEETVGRRQSINLRTAVSRDSLNSISAGLGSSLYNLGADSTENTVSIVIAQKYLEWCLLFRCRGNLFTESLPRNERLLCLRYSGFQVSGHKFYNKQRTWILQTCSGENADINGGWGRKWQEDKENCITKKFIICIRH